jgi:uncharacterized protein involved in response to NO
VQSARVPRSSRNICVWQGPFRRKTLGTVLVTTRVVTSQLGFLPLGQRQRPTQRSRFALLEKGFRPFFLLAAAYGLLAVPVWLLFLRGALGSSGTFPPLQWHAHEMLFGYATAVIAGFLLTAVSRWTERETLVGLPLLGLVAVWLAGRVAMSVALSPWLVMLLDVAFLPALAVAIGRPIVASRNYRNLVMVALLALLTLSNALTHLELLGVAPGWGRRGLSFATDLITLMMLVIAGRVIPMFTRNALGLPHLRSRPGVDRATLASAALLFATELALGPSAFTALLAVACGALVATRMASWGSWASRREPMLWILHAGHAWIALGLCLRGAAWLWPILGSSALHALTAGAIGTLTVGMMARVSLGHTGRLITAGRLTSCAFVLITLAAGVRVLAPLLPASYLTSLSAAGVLWSLSLVCLLLDHAAKLVTPRWDGAPG